MNRKFRFRQTDMNFIDLSHINSEFDWSKMSPDVKGVILKATEGSSYKDTTFIPHLNKARAAGLYVGAYHFFHPTIPAKVQADLYFSRGLDFSQPKTLNPIIDFEDTDENVYVAHNKAEVEANLRQFVNLLKSGSGRQNVTIYTYNGFWGETFGSTAFADTNLWVASYQTAQPKMFGGWKEYALWQFSQRGSYRNPGDGGDIDWSVLNPEFDINKL